MSAVIISFPPAIARAQEGLAIRMRQLSFSGHSRQHELRNVANELSLAHELFWQKPSLISVSDFVAVWTKARLLYRDCTGEMI